MTNKTLTEKEMFEKFGAQKEHAQQVEKYAEKILDALNECGFTNFSQREKQYLKTAALLHDIGYHIDKKAHHKHTMNLILEYGLEGFDEEETKLIANIARYHRSSFPNEEKHKNYAALSVEQKKLVSRLGAILRIADGMDKPDKNLILRVQAQQTQDSIDFYLKTIGFKPKLKMAQEKSDLFQEVFKKQVNFNFL